MKWRDTSPYGNRTIRISSGLRSVIDGGYQRNRIPVTKQELYNLGLDSAALTTLCLKHVYVGDWPQRTGRGCAL